MTKSKITITAINKGGIKISIDDESYIYTKNKLNNRTTKFGKMLESAGFTKEESDDAEKRIRDGFEKIIKEGGTIIQLSKKEEDKVDRLVKLIKGNK